MKNENKLIEYRSDVAFDAIMLQWYKELVMSGAIKDLFNFRARALSGFYASLQPPVHLLCRIDDNGLWYAAMVTPIFAGAEFDMWIRPDKRASKEWLESMFEALEFGFDRYGTLIGLTAHEDLLDAHKRLGYTIVGKVPNLWDGERDLWVMYVTKAAFEARSAHVVRRASNG